MLNKIFTIEKLQYISKRWRDNGKHVVLCHGCFDWLHIGHMKHLFEAKSFGDILIVTVTDDENVNKGPGRPIFNAEMRAEMLSALEFVDYVGINYGEDASDAIIKIKPDFYIKGSDYIASYPKHNNEEAAVKEAGSTSVFTRAEKFSTTEFLKRKLQ